MLKADGQPVEIGGIGTMSKSKNNGVDPQALIDQYGADTARLFMMFASPPEQTLEWSDAGVEGATPLPAPGVGVRVRADAARDDCRQAAGSRTARKRTRRCAAKSTRSCKQANYDLQRIQYNTVVSACMKMLNALEAREARRFRRMPARSIAEGLSILLRVLSPIAPHITHELWQELGYGESTSSMRPGRSSTPRRWCRTKSSWWCRSTASCAAASACRRMPTRPRSKRPRWPTNTCRNSSTGTPKKIVVVPGRLVNIVV